MKIDSMPLTELQEPSWHATYILRPDMVALASSIGEFGIMSPLIVQEKSGILIDGTQRLRIALGNKHINEKLEGQVPVHLVDCDDLEAMVLHVQLNRGRGQVVAKKLSAIVKKMQRSRRYQEKDFERLFCMKYDELELMLDGTILKHRDVSNYNYSRAWVPVEAPAGTIDAGGALLERPPNSDR